MWGFERGRAQNPTFSGSPDCFPGVSPPFAPAMIGEIEKK